MDAQNSCEEQADRENRTMQNSDDDAEEALSLCDLPIYGGAAAADCGDLSGVYKSSSSSDQDCFEFFSEQWSTTSYLANDVVFCGKLITCRDKPPVPGDPYKLESNKQRKHKNRGVFRWNFMCLNKSNSSKTSKSNDLKGRLVKKKESKLNCVSSCKSVTVRRVSILASPSKSRWYLLMFGSARFPPEMEMRDIRRRQSRRSMLTNGGDKKSGRRSTGKGLWALIGALGCGGVGLHHVNAAVKVSYGCA